MHRALARRERLLARAFGIASGVVADRLIGDPHRFHPVAGFGAAAAQLEDALNRPTWRSRPLVARAVGTGYTIGLVAAAAATGALAQHAVRRLPQSAARVLGETIVIGGSVWIALGGTSLLRVAHTIEAALAVGDDDAARNWLPWLCGRDPLALDRQEMARAVVESLAENTSDAHVAPLLWAVCGGAPGVLAYRASNTLDAMVGYRNERYRHFGWSAARLDDVLNLAPARVGGVLTAAVAPGVDGRPIRALQAWRSDASEHPSPNAGVMEATAAGALGVQLGGRTPYPYGTEERPILGAGGRVVEVSDIARAAQLERFVQLVAAVLATMTLLWAAGMSTD